MGYEVLLERVSALCDERGISTAKAYADCGVGKNFAVRIREGKVPSVERIQKLAEYFGVPTDYLLGITNIKKELPPEDVERVHAFANELLSNGALPDLSDESIKRLLAFINASGGLFEKFRND